MVLKCNYMDSSPQHNYNKNIGERYSYCYTGVKELDVNGSSDSQRGNLQPLWSQLVELLTNRGCVDYRTPFSTFCLLVFHLELHILFVLVVAVGNHTIVLVSFYFTQSKLAVNLSATPKFIIELSFLYFIITISNINGKTEFISQWIPRNFTCNFAE